MGLWLQINETVVVTWRLTAQILSFPMSYLLFTNCYDQKNGCSVLSSVELLLFAVERQKVRETLVARGVSTNFDVLISFTVNQLKAQRDHVEGD
jgi:hypothetical protein